MKMRHKKSKESHSAPPTKSSKSMPPSRMKDGDPDDIYIPKDMPPMMGDPPKRRLDRKRGGRTGC